MEFFDEEFEKLYREKLNKGLFAITCKEYREQSEKPGRLVCYGRVYHDESRETYEEGQVEFDIIEKPNGEIVIRPIPGGEDKLTSGLANKFILRYVMDFYGLQLKRPKQP